MQMLYQVWVEGYRATGDAGNAQLLGTYWADTFRDACDEWVLSLPKNEQQLYDPLAITYWDCRLFDNEADARRSFG